MVAITNFYGYPNPWTDGVENFTISWDQDSDFSIQIRWYALLGGSLVRTDTTVLGGFPAGSQGRNYFYYTNIGLSSNPYVVRLYYGGSLLAETTIVVG